MLDISELPSEPQSEDWGFVFAGRNTVTSLRGQPGLPWRLSEVTEQWGVNSADAVPVGRWQDRGAWAFSVPEDSINQTEHLSGNLYGLLGRVEDSLFHAHGRAYQLLYWRDTHRHCGRCGSLTRAIEDGRAVLCDSCSLRVYPRVSPCVIVLVRKGDKLLLSSCRRISEAVLQHLGGLYGAG